MERSCCICLEGGFQLGCGLECRAAPANVAHFVCASCLGQHVETALGADLYVRQAAKGLVRCPVRPCHAPAYSHGDLARHLKAPLFDRYVAALASLGEAAMAAETEVRIQARLDAKVSRMQASSRQERAQEIRHKVVDEILTVKCPMCRQAFVDFEGCFALTCSRCGCGLCAWCGRYCGIDAHEHVRTCSASQAPGALFGSSKQFNEALRRRRTKRLRDFLHGLDTEMRGPLLEALSGDLKDLGITTAPLLRRPKTFGFWAMCVILSMSIVMNAKLWYDRQHRLSLPEVLAEARGLAQCHTDSVTDSYERLLTELRSDVGDMYFQIRNGLSRGLRGDVGEVIYAPLALIVCSALIPMVGGLVTVLAGIHTAVLARRIPCWFVKGGKRLFWLRVACFPVRSKWPALLKERHELVLKAAQHGLVRVVDVDPTTPLAFSPTVSGGQRFGPEVRLRFRGHYIARTHLVLHTNIGGALPGWASAAMVTMMGWLFGSRRSWHRRAKRVVDQSTRQMDYRSCSIF